MEYPSALSSSRRSSSLNRLNTTVRRLPDKACRISSMDETVLTEGYCKRGICKQWSYLLAIPTKNIEVVRYLSIFQNIVGYADAVQRTPVVSHDASSEHTNRRHADLVRVDKLAELRIISWYL